MVLRKANLDDIDLLIRLRIDYLNEEKGKLSHEEESTVIKQLRTYFTKHISNNTFIGVFAEIESNVVSMAYLSVFEKPANQTFITGVTGTLFNVLTYLEYRGKGIATKVINKVIEEAKALNVSRIDLFATSDGKYLYEKMGFKEPNYTAMYLEV